MDRQTDGGEFIGRCLLKELRTVKELGYSKWMVIVPCFEYS